MFPFILLNVPQEICFEAILFSWYISCGGCGGSLPTVVQASCIDCISLRAAFQIKHSCMERCKRRFLGSLKYSFCYAGHKRKIFYTPIGFLTIWLLGPFNKTLSIKQFENKGFPINFPGGKLFLFLQFQFPRDHHISQKNTLIQNPKQVQFISSEG